MPAQECDPKTKSDVFEDIEYTSENHIIHHVEEDSDDDNDTIEMESESEDELPEANEFPIFDITSLTFVIRFHRIMTCLGSILCAMQKCLNTYPPESAIGSSLRSRNLNFLTSWRFIFEKIHIFFESSAYVITNQKISSDTICNAIQNMGNEDENWLVSGISVVMGVKDRIDYVLEAVSSVASDNETSKSILKNLDRLIFYQIALIPDGNESYDIVKEFYEKLEAHLPSYAL